MTGNSRLLELVSRFPEVKVLLWGDLVLDRYILGSPKRISREAPVIILRWEGQEDRPGGGANALANLLALGVKARVVGIVGDDEEGKALLALLEQKGADTSWVQVVPGYRTPTKVRILGGGPGTLKHQMARYDVEPTEPPSARFLDGLSQALREAAKGVDAVAISDYGYGAALPELVSQVSGVKWICLDSRHALAQFSGVGGATPNLEELADWAGKVLENDEDIAKAAEELRRRLAARFVLATMGNRGMTLVEEGKPPIRIEIYGTDQVADVTGAGDTVLAALVASLAAGATPEEAARIANYAGGISVMKHGTATVSRAELASAIASEQGA